MELKIAATKTFKSFDLDIDVTVSQDKVGVFGPSGSGKSTIVNLLAGLQRPDQGAIQLNGETLFDSRINLPPEQRRIGIIFQHPHLFPHLSVKGNLLYGHKRCPHENRRINFDRLVEVLRIEHLLERGVNKLSGGEKQRVAIGRAVLSSPRLLLMDEPLSALDDTLRFQIINHLKEVCEAFSIPYLFISHSLLEMRLMTDQVLEMENGKVLSQGPPDDLARKRMGISTVGYINLLRLSASDREGGMTVYRWGNRELRISTSGSSTTDSLYELSSKDIILCKRHPEAISARNLLHCTVRSSFPSGSKTGIELECGSETLIAEVVSEAAQELGLTPGAEVFALIKASAFRRLS